MPLTRLECSQLADIFEAEQNIGDWTFENTQSKTLTLETDIPEKQYEKLMLSVDALSLVVGVTRVVKTSETRYDNSTISFYPSGVQKKYLPLPEAIERKKAEILDEEKAVKIVTDLLRLRGNNT